MGTYETGAGDEAEAPGAGPTLTAEIRRVLARVDAHAARAAGPGTAPEADDGSGHRDGAVSHVQNPAGPATAPLDALVGCFGLTPFERDLVLLTAAYELDPTTAARCAAASGDRSARTPPSRWPWLPLPNRTGAPSPRSHRCGAGASWSWTTSRA